jgi:hypothetical protein
MPDKDNEKKKKGEKDGKGNLTVVDGGPDLGVQIIPIEKDKVHGKLRKKIVELQSSIDRSRWELAGELNKVNDKTLYVQWGYPSWEKYVSGEVHLNVRTAQYLCAMYVFFTKKLGEKIADDQEREEMIEAVKELGWTKARCLVDICTPKDYKEWFELARKLSSSELEAETKKALVRKNGGDPDNVQSMKTFTTKLAEGQQEIVDQAFEIAGGIADSKKRGHLLSLICQTFVSDNMAKDEGKDKNRNRMLRRIAATYGVELIVVDPDTKKVLLGKKLLEKVSATSEETTEGTASPEEAKK